ncbi:hypothetical protein [Roseovarius sp. MMSF_3281]|uniref:hypothetical protein n=1 Tax=Roseovarius sp. MMSF_3281 TaxID=3046694 RepID=UPI00273DDF7C|nr:hypothetical protein [Roseovarius sp. MMSF_3281]
MQLAEAVTYNLGDLHDPYDQDFVDTKSIYRKAYETNTRGFAYRMLNRFKTMNGKRYQLHATRGWKCIGRAKGGA